MPLVATTAAQRERTRGVATPGYPNAGDTSDWRDPMNSRRVKAVFDVLDLDTALATIYPADQHLVSYVIRRDGAPLGRQPRVKKDALDWLRGEGFEVTCDVFFADVDNTDHEPWKNADAARAEGARVAALVPTAGVYATSAGLRVVQPLTYAMPADLFELASGEWLIGLDALIGGKRVDFSCRDWTRWFRLPHVIRAGAPYRSPFVDTSRMVAADPPKVTETPARRASGRRRAAKPIAFNVEFPANLIGLDAMLDALAIPIRDRYHKTRHGLFMALGGAFLAHGLTAEQLPVVLGELANRSGAVTSDAIAIGRDTSHRKNVGLPVVGLGNLRHGWPLVADALEPFLVVPIAPVVELIEPTETLEQTTARMRHAIANAPDGVTGIQAACGLGKSWAAIDVAIERASKATPFDSRAPLQSKTAISVPTHKLANQYARALEARGVKTKRLFGIASQTSAGGAPECRFSEQAQSLSRGGLSVAQLLCEGGGKNRCEYAEDCSAFGGSEGAGLVLIGPHQLLSRLDAEAGKTGLLVIDEPPPAITTVEITAKMVETAFGSLGRFDGRYAAAIAPALLAVQHWIEHLAPAGEAHPLSHALASGVDAGLLEDAFNATGATDALEALRSCFVEGHIGTAPLIRASSIGALRSPTAYGQAEARRIGAASEIYDAVRRAMLETLSSAVVVDAGKHRVMHLTLSDARLIKAASREGATVVLDANLDDHLPILSRVIGYDPPVHRFNAADGAHIDRMFYQMNTSRKALDSDPAALTAALDKAVAWLAEAPAETVGVVTYASFEERAKSELGGMGRHVETLHYGGLRGRNDWEGFDAIITIGDPRPNLSITQQEMDLFELDWDEAVKTKARGELEQAHGRLRTIHRTRPGRLLHIGSVMPGGWQGRCDVTPFDGGRSLNTGGISAEELHALVDAIGGIRPAARDWSVSHVTLIRYLSGERAVPAGFPPSIALEAQ